jgi:hypothetical protein
MNIQFKYLISVFSLVLIAGFIQVAYTPNVGASGVGPEPINDLRVIGDKLYWTTPSTDTTIDTYFVAFYSGTLPYHTADGSKSEMNSQGISFGGCMLQSIETAPCISSYHVETTPGGSNYATLNDGYNTNKTYMVLAKDVTGNFSDYSNLVTPNFSYPFVSGSGTLSIEGNYLRWYAPANVHHYKISYYTGRTDKSPSTVDYDGCSFETGNDSHSTPLSYCVGNTNEGDKITRAYNHKEALRVNTSNTYRVRAYNISGTLIMDTYGPIDVIENPERITNLSYNSSNRRLSWTAPADVDKYIIKFYTGNRTDYAPNINEFGGCSYPEGTTCASSTESYNYSGNEYITVDDNWDYNSFIIYYKDSNGIYSKTSNSVYVTPDLDSDTARITNLSYNKSSRRLSWTAPTNSNKYIIKFYTGQITDYTPDKSDFRGCEYPSGTTCASSTENYNYVGNEYVTVDNNWNYKTFIIYYRDDNGRYSDASNPVYVTPFIQSPSNPFVDIDGHLFQDEIVDVFDRGIVEGYGGGFFRPNYFLSRAELLKIVLVAEYPTTNFSAYAGNGCFYDVNKAEWWTGYICFAKSRGIIEGYANGTFDPTRNVSVPEALKMAMETLDPLDYTFDTDNVDPDYWFMPYLYNGNGFLAPYAEGGIWDNPNTTSIEYDILPFRKILRGEMAFMIDKILESVGR